MGLRSSYTKIQKTTLVENWIISGQTSKEYCLRNNLAPSPFFNWITAYRNEFNVPSDVRTRDLTVHFVPVKLPEVKPSEVQIKTKEFIPIQPIEDLPEKSFTVLQVETFSKISITYPSGVRLKINSKITLTQLQTLLLPL